MKITNRRTYQNWTDIAFTALPAGWFNVFENDNGAHYTEPCPGVLVQECTSSQQISNEEHDDGRVALHSRTDEIEREVRTVFVSAGYVGESYLRPVDDEPNYVVTTTPEQWDRGQVQSLEADA